MMRYLFVSAALSMALGACATKTGAETEAIPSTSLHADANGRNPLMLTDSQRRVLHIREQGLGPAYDALYARLEASGRYPVEDARGETPAQRAASRERLLRSKASFWASVGMTGEEWDRLKALGVNPIDAISPMDGFEGADSIRAALTLTKAPVLANLRGVTSNEWTQGGIVIEADVEKDLKGFGVPDTIVFGRGLSSATADDAVSGRCVLFLSKGRYDDRKAAEDRGNPSSFIGPGPYLELASPLCEKADGRFHMSEHHGESVSISEVEILAHMERIAP